MKQRPTGHSAPASKTSIQWYRYLLSAIRKSGLNSDEIAESVGFDLANLNNPELYVSDQFTALLLLSATDKSGNPSFGISAGQYFVPSAFGPLGYAMMTSATLREALERTTFYTASVTDTTRTRLTCTGSSCLFEIQMPSYLPEVTRIVDEFMLTSILTSFRWLVGYDFIPLNVEFIHDEPAYIDKHIKIFGLKPLFRSQRCAFTFSNEQLDSPLIYADDAMAKHHDNLIVNSLNHRCNSSCTPQVRRIIQQQLHTGEPTLGKVAELLKIGDRTLQRRLKDEGQTYHDLVDDVRCGLLDVYLSNSTLPLKEIAVKLGFADQSSFTRAVQRWHGQTPKALRSTRQ